MPGTDPKDIRISLLENLLTIKGEKWQDWEEKEELLAEFAVHEAGQGALSWRWMVAEGRAEPNGSVP